MNAELAWTLTGLALLDSLNASTLGLVMVILLSARQPIPSALLFTVGATLCFFGIAVGLHFGASIAESTFADAITWIRRGTFTLLAVVLVYLAIRRLRDRPRKPVLLPAWFGPIAAFPVGIAVTFVDLPNAFPLFIAIETLVTFAIEPIVAVWTIAAYTIIYAVPVVVVLVLGALMGNRIRSGMQRILDRFFAGTARRSVPLAGLFSAAALGSGAIVALSFA